MELIPSLAVLAGGTPVYLALLTGIVLAIVKWREHPLASMLALIGLGLMLLLSIGGTLINVWLPISLERAGKSMPEISATISIVGIARSFIAAVCWGLIVAAIFIGRRPEKSTTLAAG